MNHLRIGQLIHSEWKTDRFIGFVDCVDDIDYHGILHILM